MPGQGRYTTSMTNPTQFANISHALSGNPIITALILAVNITNSTGSMGRKPSYNYFFPSEHTKVHTLKTVRTAPWQLKSGTDKLQVICRAQSQEL